MQIVPISETGWRGPAKPAAYGVAVDWARHELVDGKYVSFALADGDVESIHKIIPVPVRVDGAVVALRITP